MFRPTLAQLVPLLMHLLPETHSVAADDAYWRTNTVQLPVTTSGTYYLVFETDIGNSSRRPTSLTMSLLYRSRSISTSLTWLQCLRRSPGRPIRSSMSSGP
jgi:hypothetical protein